MNTQSVVLDYSVDTKKSLAVLIPAEVNYLGLVVPSLVDGIVSLEVFTPGDLHTGRLLGAAAYGSDLFADAVVTGVFTSATTGWTADAATLSSVAAGQAGNCLKVLSTGNAASFAKATLIVQRNHFYQCTYYFKVGTAAQGQFDLGTAAKGTQYHTSGVMTDANWTVQKTTYFQATQEVCHITCKSVDPTTNEYGHFDTLVLREASPLVPDCDVGWYPVIDNSDGQDANICDNTYDPAVVDITPYVIGFGGHYMRVVTAGTQTADLIFRLISQ